MEAAVKAIAPDGARLSDLIADFRRSKIEVAMAYLAIAKDLSADFLELKWVPRQMSDEKLHPDMCHSLGAPWLYLNKQATARWGSELLPFQGIGHFLVGVDSPDGFPVYVFAWPIQVELDYGQTLDTMFAYLTGLGNDEMSKFMEDHMFHAELESARTCWIPYGWDYVMISRLAHAECSPVPVLCIPYFCYRLATAMSESVVELMLKTARVNAEKKQQKQPWTDLGPAYVSWLERLLQSISTGTDIANSVAESGRPGSGSADIPLGPVTGNTLSGAGSKKGSPSKAASAPKAKSTARMLR